MLEGILEISIFILSVIAIFDILSSQASIKLKLIWTAIVLFLPLLGVIIYYTIGKRTYFVKRQY